jgi:hypothetical protein
MPRGAAAGCRASPIACASLALQGFRPAEQEHDLTVVGGALAMSCRPASTDSRSRWCPASSVRAICKIELGPDLRMFGTLLVGREHRSADRTRSGPGPWRQTPVTCLDRRGSPTMMMGSWTVWETARPPFRRSSKPVVGARPDSLAGVHTGVHTSGIVHSQKNAAMSSGRLPNRAVRALRGSGPSSSASNTGRLLALGPDRVREPSSLLAPPCRSAHVGATHCQRSVSCWLCARTEARCWPRSPRLRRQTARGGGTRACPSRCSGLPRRRMRNAPGRGPRPRV